MTSSAARTVDDLTKVIDQTPIGPFQIRIVALSFALIVIDGYCLLAPGFAAPSIARDWMIQDEARLGLVLAASLLGMIIGAPLFGFIGDRFGRRPAVLIATAIFAGFTALSAFAGNPTELAALRFIDGIGIGGVTSNIIALVSEYMPRRMRTLAVIGTLAGTSVGGALPALVRVFAPPDLVWQSIFLIGGIAGAIVFGMALAGLPDSPASLWARGHHAKALAILSKITSTPPAPLPAGIENGRTGSGSSLSPGALFRDGLGLVTPLLWLMNFSNFLAIFFVVSWTPYVLEAANVTHERAALVNAVFSLAGIAGGLIVARIIDRRGPLALAGMFAVGAPAVAAIGLVGAANFGLLLLAAGLAGAAVVGNQFALGAISTKVYPSDRRSAGAGWALSVGRIGSLSGPLLGGALVASALPLPMLYGYAAAPLVAGALASLTLFGLQRTTVAA
ncbi:MAG: MFS transporter [Hyphomonadaceae bacterium]